MTNKYSLMIKTKEDLYLYIREDKKRNLGSYKIGFVKYVVSWLYGTDEMKAYRLLRALRKLERGEWSTC